MPSNQVTVFLLTTGSPQFKKTLEVITEQILKTNGLFTLDIIENVSPFSEACNSMLLRCKTPFFIQLDEDMILDDGTLELMLNTMKKELENNPNICQYVFRLRDDELGNILGVKIYNYNIVKNYKWKHEVSSDRLFNQSLKNDGYEIKVYGTKNDTVGTHGLYRSQFELFLKNITIANKAKIQLTSSDIKHFINMYNKSCLNMNTKDSFFRLGGLYYGLTHNIEEDFRTYPVDVFSKINNFFKHIESNFNKNQNLLYEDKTNEILFLIFASVQLNKEYFLFPPRLDIYIERKQFFTKEDRVFVKYIIENIPKNTTIYTLDSIFMQTPLFLSLYGYKNEVLYTNNRNKTYIEYVLPIINKVINNNIILSDINDIKNNNKALIMIKNENLKYFKTELEWKLLLLFLDIIFLSHHKNEKLYNDIYNFLLDNNFRIYKKSEDYVHLKRV